MKIILCGGDRRTVACKGFLKQYTAHHTGRLYLLPIPSARGEYIGKSKISFASLQRKVSKNDVVAGYGIPPETTRNLTRIGVLVLDTAKNEAFLAENAVLTADAALGKVITLSQKAPSETHFAVVGYGRIGRALVQILLFLGGQVTVFTSSERTRLALGEIGIGTVLSLPAENRSLPMPMPRCDVLINTAPAKIFCPADLSVLGEAKIVELASGENFPDGTPLLRLPSLPAKVYPLSAGRAYADAIAAMLAEVKR